MPYITPHQRAKFPDLPSMGIGELNYLISRALNEYILMHGGLRYNTINDCIGVLECAKLELYRRVAAPYEDKKIEENSDVYDRKITND